jgi:hypothetical protein
MASVRTAQIDKERLVPLMKAFAAKRLEGLPITMAASFEHIN